MTMAKPTTVISCKNNDVGNILGNAYCAIDNGNISCMWEYTAN